MKRALPITRPLRLATLAAAVALLSACASIDIDQAVQSTNEALPAYTGGKLALERTDAQRDERAQRSAELLAQPLTLDGAVQLALANSPALQALLAQSWAELAEADQSGRIANALFSFERMRFGPELEIGRLLSVGLVDLLTLPQKQAAARGRIAQARTQLAITVVGEVGQVRQAWVRAVAARQSLTYADQVKRSAEASAELARRMQQVGNFNRLQRARQQAFYADAATEFAEASHAATAAREELVRRLGLDAQQTAQLKLPERLPDLPAQPRAGVAVSAQALEQRLDLQLARQQVDTAARAQGLGRVTSLLDVEVGGRHDTVFDDASGQRSNRNGFELDIRLPLFDWGGAQRGALDARALEAARHYDAVARGATSQLRERYSAYRTAWDVARHYRDEVVPLRQAIADENVSRYNGMLIGVFELLAEQRDQVAAVRAAIEAQQRFWLADAALSSSITGAPAAAQEP